MTMTKLLNSEKIKMLQRMTKNIRSLLMFLLVEEESKLSLMSQPGSVQCAIFNHLSRIHPRSQFGLKVYQQTDFITLRCHLLGNIVNKMSVTQDILYTIKKLLATRPWLAPKCFLQILVQLGKGSSELFPPSLLVY